MYHLTNLIIPKLFIPKTLRRIGEDLRKAGAIAGIGFVGFVLPNDGIETLESFALVVFGILSWCIGLYFEYLVDRIETKPLTVLKNRKDIRRQL